MAVTTPGRRLGRLERPAIAGVLVREVVNFSSYWRAATFSSTVEPTIYLLAFGFGFGSLVSTIGGYDYVDFVGTGTVATAVLFSSAFPAMFGTFVKYQFQRTYDAILAAPVDTEELVTAEALWIAARAEVANVAAYQHSAWQTAYLVMAASMLVGVVTVLFTREPRPREVFVYFISAAKERNPAAAMALLQQLGNRPDA